MKGKTKKKENMGQRLSVPAQKDSENNLEDSVSIW